ncbi:MAG: EAL domain-containing protein [Pseudomonadota bacterium]
MAEGAVVAGFQIDLTEVFPDNEVAQETFVIGFGPSAHGEEPLPQNAELVPLATTDLAAVLVPDAASVAAAGRTLLLNTVSALSLVLTGAFAVLAWLGRTVILEPHLRLDGQRQELAELAAVSERAKDAILVTNLDGEVLWSNPAFEGLTGYSIDEIRGKKPGTLLQGPETDLCAARKLGSAVRNRTAAACEILNYRKSGATYWISISISPLTDEEGDVYGFMAISRDVTEAREQKDAILKAKKEIERQALQDPLTGLPNRRALDMALKERADAIEDGATVIRIDLDHFKYVNDTLGHEAGDYVLNEVARILREETKHDDLPARVGGDEFVLLLAPRATSRDAIVLAERMLARIKSTRRFDGKTVRVGASFGVASTLDGLLPLHELVIGADSALYNAKDLGRNRVCLYSPELHRSVLDRRALAREMRLAIANEEFVPHFQPQFDAKTREIVGVETLVRWQSPSLGLLYPDAFMPVAQQLSVVEEIDAIIFAKALNQIKALVDDGLAIPKVSFNVTAERIQDEASYASVLNHVGGPKVAFEILESVLVEEQSDAFRFSLDRLRDAGISIEIDDFGSGHASIVGLIHLNPDVMKIDQRLVMPAPHSDTARGLLKQIIGMAELTGLKVTAEGVETHEHIRILTELGCDTLQGYAFCKAMNIDGLRSYMTDRGSSNTRRAKH